MIETEQVGDSIYLRGLGFDGFLIGESLMKGEDLLRGGRAHQA